jgi:hypothetical protein
MGTTFAMKINVGIEIWAELGQAPADWGGPTQSHALAPRQRGVRGNYPAEILASSSLGSRNE